MNFTKAKGLRQHKASVRTVFPSLQEYSFPDYYSERTMVSRPQSHVWKRDTLSDLDLFAYPGAQKPAEMLFSQHKERGSHHVSFREDREWVHAQRHKELSGSELDDYAEELELISRIFRGSGRLPHGHLDVPEFLGAFLSPQEFDLHIKRNGLYTASNALYQTEKSWTITYIPHEDFARSRFIFSLQPLASHALDEAQAEHFYESRMLAAYNSLDKDHIEECLPQVRALLSVPMLFATRTGMNFHTMEVTKNNEPVLTQEVQPTKPLRTIDLHRRFTLHLPEGVFDFDILAQLYASERFDMQRYKQVKAHLDIFEKTLHTYEQRIMASPEEQLQLLKQEQFLKAEQLEGRLYVLKEGEKHAVQKAEDEVLELVHRHALAENEFLRTELERVHARLRFVQQRFKDLVATMEHHRDSLAGSMTNLQLLNDLEPPSALIDQGVDPDVLRETMQVQIHHLMNDLKLLSLRNHLSLNEEPFPLKEYTAQLMHVLGDEYQARTEDTDTEPALYYKDTLEFEEQLLDKDVYAHIIGQLGELTIEHASAGRPDCILRKEGGGRNARIVVEFMHRGEFYSDDELSYVHDVSAAHSLSHSRRAQIVHSMHKLLHELYGGKLTVENDNVLKLGPHYTLTFPLKQKS